MSILTSPLVHESEVVKTGDINYIFSSTIQNFASILKDELFRVDKDILIRGFSVQERGTPSMNVDVTGGLAYEHSTEQIVHNNELNGPIAFEAADPTNPRYDIVQVRQYVEEYDTQVRAFKNPITSAITYSSVNTKQRYTTEYSVKKGTADVSPVAPAKDVGYVKLAEVYIPASSSTILDENIYNCEAIYKNPHTSNTWTTEDDITYHYSLLDLQQTSESRKYKFTIKGFYDASVSLPSSPDELDCYVCSKAGNGWTLNYIYLYYDAVWKEVVPEESDIVTYSGIIYTYALGIWRQLISEDFVVGSSTDWINVIERVSANVYKFKDDYKNILVKNITGGFLISDILSGGDTWATIQTNNTNNLRFESGAYLNVGDTASYMEVNTDDAVLENVWIKGTGSVATSASHSFLLNAYRVIFRNCKTSNRLLNNNFVGFQGSGTAGHNYTSKYENCSIFTIDATTTNITGFVNCYNINNTVIYDIDTTTGNIIGLDTCRNISSVFAYDFDTTSGTIIGMYQCYQFSNCNMNDFEGGSTVTAYDACEGGNSCIAFGITTTSGLSAVTGFDDCDVISGCIAQNITSSSTGRCVGFYSCYCVSSCKASTVNNSGGSAYGFNNCDCVSGCNSITIDASGNAHGYYQCRKIGACDTTDVDGSSNSYGFYQCTYGAALYTDEAVNSNNDWIDTVDANVTNKVSTPSVWT